MAVNKLLKSAADIRLLPQYFRHLLTTSSRQTSELSAQTRLLANMERDRLIDSLDDKKGLRLEPHGFKAFSQNDEDGIIAEIFNRIGTTERSFVEFGTGNGCENNTLYLLKQGWRGLWIDGSPKNHESQKTYFQREVSSKDLICLQSFLTTENINSVISSSGYRGEIDLLSIDIDGNDYHLWKAIEVVNPRVVVIEYNGYIPPPIKWIMAYKPDYVWDGRSTCHSASISSFIGLADCLGYRLVGCNITGLNAFFVRKSLFNTDLFNPAAEELFHPRRWWLDVCYHTNPIDWTCPTH